MSKKAVFKIIIDIAMTVLLLLLMAYEMVGRQAHEWLGISIFALFAAHHILNAGWSKSIFKGRYTAFRIFQTVLAVMAFLSMIGSAVSGIILSEYVFSFLKIRGGSSFARTLHMLSAYWGLVFMSLHLGTNWGVIIGMIKKLTGNQPKAVVWIFRILGAVIAAYGVYAFKKRMIGEYMLLINHFAFFDFEEPLLLFIADYAAVMVLFVWAGYYLTKILRRIAKKAVKGSEVQ